MKLCVSLLLALFLPSISSAATTCQSCITSGKQWCDSDAPQCDINNCKRVVKDSQNCPLYPDPAYAYNDTYARYTVLPLVVSVFREDPTECLKNALPSTVFYKGVRVQCYKEGPKSTCHCYTAYDPVSRTIIVAFEGTDGPIQMTEEIMAFFVKKVPFYDHGHIFEYFNNAFFFLWNGGLQQAVSNLRYQHPDYSLVVVGHSLGAAIASVFASYSVKMNLFQPQNVKLMTFGQPRTGDKEFADWHDTTFPYSYRVVHHRDPVPHVPPMGGPDEVFHHRYEVWYNNDMKPGANYTVCHEADGPYCSNTQIDMITTDHMYYYADMGDYLDKGCPKNYWN